MATGSSGDAHRSNRESVGGFLFAYFTSANEPDGEQVRFAVSRTDAPTDWMPLNNGAPFLVSNVGERGVRDPFLLRSAGLPGETAHFYLLATDLRIAGRDPRSAWTDCQRHGSRSIVIWETTDLIEWSSPRLLQVAPPEAGNAWAPEATFDPASGSYFVYWASALYTGDSRDQPAYNRMFAARTRDFWSISEPEIWVDPGWSVIDATVVVDDDGWHYRFIKDERSPDSRTPSAKFITLERSRDLTSRDYELVADGIGRNAVQHGEGPIVVRSPREALWYLFIDEFTLRRYQAFSAQSLDSPEWTHRPDIDVPAGASHGSILRLEPEEAARLRGVASGPRHEADP